MAEIKSFRDLNVYKKARAEARSIFVLTKSFPREERYSLSDQVLGSSRAANAMIAEAWAKRRYEAALVSKINDALGEAMETQTWLDHAWTAPTSKQTRSPRTTLHGSRSVACSIE